MDAHNSEYIAECDERIAFISGFKGSNGLCVITKDDARMWTDGRYYLAASKQLEHGWTMEKMEAGVLQWPEWIIEKFPNGAKVGFDFTQYPAANLEQRAKSFEDAKIEIISVPNLVDATWGTHRPQRPQNEVKHLDIKFTG
jgi:Xaa-Pro aminopeptidase